MSKTTAPQNDKGVLHAYIAEAAWNWWMYIYDDHGWEDSMPCDVPEGMSKAGIIRYLEDSASIWGYSQLDLQEEYGVAGKIDPLRAAATRVTKQKALLAAARKPSLPKPVARLTMLGVVRGVIGAGIVPLLMLLAWVDSREEAR